MPLPILIVDDDEPTQQLLEAILRRSGWRCETVSNGAMAIESLQANAYAAVILDLMMPEVGGGDVIAFIRDRGQGPPVIVCSAAGPRALAELDPLIVRAVVRKPFDIDELTGAVASLARK